MLEKVLGEDFGLIRTIEGFTEVLNSVYEIHMEGGWKPFYRVRIGDSSLILFDWQVADVVRRLGEGVARSRNSRGKDLFTDLLHAYQKLKFELS